MNAKNHFVCVNRCVGSSDKSESLITGAQVVITSKATGVPIDNERLARKRQPFCRTPCMFGS
jgi:hypothetical protein